MASAAAEPQLDKNGIKFLDDAVDFAGSTRDADLQRVAATLCGWTSQDAAIFQISGGITNLLFKMSPKDGQDPVLIRVFGAKTEMMINRERDNSKCRFFSIALPCADTSLCLSFSCVSPAGRS